MNIDDNGDGTANLDFEIWPENEGYNYYGLFTDTADPGEGEFQKPDSLDGELYRHLVLATPDLAHGIFEKIEPSVLNVLRSKTLEYVHTTSMMKIQLQVRQIQYLEYLQTSGVDQPGILMRIRYCENVIEGEFTKITAVDTKYVIEYPDLDWVGRGLLAAGFLSCGISWWEERHELMQDINDYTNEVRRHVNEGGADILSSQIQSMLEDIPGLNVIYYYALDPTVPIFSLYGPLGWYDGY